MLIIIYSWLGVLGISEGIISILKRSNSENRKTSGDQISLYALWLVIPSCIAFTIHLININVITVPFNAIAVIGLSISVMGSLIRWSAIYQLKNVFTIDLSISTNHQLKTNGLYNYMRHPSYSGLFLNYFGILVISHNMYLIVGFSFLIFIAINYRIFIEEKMLITEFGDTYLAYKKVTKALFPYLF